MVAQLTSTAAAGALGITGTYALSIPEQTVASGTVVGTYGILTNSGSGVPVSGGVLSGNATVSGTTVWGQYGATTWVVSPTQTETPTTETINVETKWYARSAGGNNELIKISDISQ